MAIEQVNLTKESSSSEQNSGIFPAKEDIDLESSIVSISKQHFSTNKKDAVTAPDSASRQDSRSSIENMSIPGAFHVANPLKNAFSDSIATITASVTPSPNNDLKMASQQKDSINVVQINSEIVAMATVVDDRDESESRNDDSKIKYIKYFVSIVSAIVTAIMIFLVLLFVIQKKQQLQPQPIDAPIKDSENYDDDTTTPEENHLSYIKYSERRESLIDILSPLIVDPRVFDSESPEVSPDRIAALEWLIANDPARVPIPVLEEVTSNNYTSDEMTETTTFETKMHKLRQRFVMALFYFATNGQHWESRYSFLTGYDECLWNSNRAIEFNFYSDADIEFKGVLCNRDGRISHIRMCK